MAFLHVSTAHVDPILQVLFEAADMRDAVKDATGQWVKEAARHAVKVHAYESIACPRSIYHSARKTDAARSVQRVLRVP
jgi:hypothetical protein